MGYTETLHFKIRLSHTSGDKKPEVKIFLDNELVYHDYLGTQKDEVSIIEFERIVAENQAHILKIDLCNKTPSDTQVDNEGNIVKDWLLDIRQIEIDEIDLNHLLWSESKYYPIYPEEYLDEAQKSVKVISECVHMGWNGSWQLEFTSPFYLWLLDRI